MLKICLSRPPHVTPCGALMTATTDLGTSRKPIALDGAKLELSRYYISTYDTMPIFQPTPI